MAIINENAGLLEDMLLMQKRTGNLNLERLDRLSQNLNKQIARSEQIITNLNIFAHTVDDERKVIDITEFLDFLIKISSRLIDMNRVTAELHPDYEFFNIKTNPFYLLNLSWIIIVEGARHINSGDKIIINSKSLDNYKVISFKFATDRTDFLNKITDDSRTKSALECLEYKLDTDPDNKEILIVINNSEVENE